MSKTPKSLQFIKKDVYGSRFYVCPFCGEEIKVESSVFYGVCPACQCTVIDYQPAPHQVAFHKSNAQYKLNIGGFGSGKTTSCCAEIMAHVYSTPNGKTLLTAPKLQQVNEAVIPELDKFIPKHLLDKPVVHHPNLKYEFKNGHEIVVFASNDEQNLRSLNLTAFYIEEASNVDLPIFEQLQARLRNSAGILRNELGEEIGYSFLGLVSTNPDEGWVRDNFLLLSGKIFASESIDKNMYNKIRVKNGEPNYHSFLASSRDNHFLPKEFISRLCIGKNEKWIRRYIDCYLDIKEGAVYPDIADSFVEPFPIPKHWQRLGGFDKGFRDETAFLPGAIDPDTGIIYVYDEYYEAERPMSYHAEQLKRFVKDYQFYLPIQADPTVTNRNERDGQTYQLYFQQISGIYLMPGNNDIDAGIEKVRDYVYLGKLKFFTTLENFKKEATGYVYKEKNTGDAKPVDRKNHLMDALRYMIMCLPQNPADFTQSVILRRTNHSQNIYGWKKDQNYDNVIGKGGVYMLKRGGNDNGRY